VSWLITGIAFGCHLGVADEISMAKERGTATPTLPATSFPAGSGIARIGPARVIAKAITLVGLTELIVFDSTLGLCIEIDHIPQKSRAGGCNISPLATEQQIKVVGQGYSAGLGRSGITEVFGQVSPSVHSVRVEYRHNGKWHRRRALVGRFPITTAENAGIEDLGWFAMDVPGCLERRHLRLYARDSDNVHLGMVEGFDQRAACRAGGGYRVRGTVTYGRLPTS
jgi:hypothetical protein